MSGRGPVAGTSRRLLALIAPHRRWIALGALLGFLAIAANVALMATSAYLISRAALVTNVAEVALAITAVRVLAIARAAFRYLERTVTHRATFEILTDLRVWFFRSVEPLAPARLAGRRSGDLLARIVADIDTLEDFYVRVVVPPLVAAGVIAFSGILLGAFDARLGAVLVACLLVAGAVLPYATHRLSRAPAAALAPERAELTALLVDEVQGLADLIALDRAEVHRARVLALGRAVDRRQRRLALVRAGSSAVGAGLAGLAGLAVLVVGIELVVAGHLDGVFLAVLPLAAIASFEAIPPVAHAFGLRATSLAAARRLFELIDADPEVTDPPHPATPPVDSAIEVRGLSFGYGPERPLVLDGLDLSIPAGTSLALVGPSGAGKSTLVSLLLRFWDYHEGEIRIGGRDLHAYAVEDVRAMLGVVAQDVHLFNTTIRDNLAVADPDLDDERMIAACRIARVHDTIAALPAGYDTRVGEDGLLLSGGERQRLAIARAVIRDAPILVLDEATANLDALTEDAVMASLAPFMAGRTTLVVTHREAVAARCDRSVVLEAGRAAVAH